jgi:microsomal dipeptidase-like Zn-dependent dipeptidase
VLEEEVPFSVTHAGCRAVRDHPRNLADWQLEALAAREGVLGMIALAFVVDPRPRRSPAGLTMSTTRSP